MLDLIIISDKPIFSKEASNLLKREFSYFIVRGDDPDTLYMKKDGEGFELWFSPNDVLDDPEHFMEETIDRCPNKKAYLTNLSYTSEEIAKKIISILKPLYGNMWIQSDEYDDWFGTADEFIDKYHLGLTND